MQNLSGDHAPEQKVRNKSNLRPRAQMETPGLPREKNHSRILATADHLQIGITPRQCQGQGETFCFEHAHSGPAPFI